MKLLTYDEAAEMLATGRRTIECLVRSGQLAAVDVSIKQQSKAPRKRIREQDLFAFIESRAVQPTTTHTFSTRRRRGHTFNN